MGNKLLIISAGFLLVTGLIIGVILITQPQIFKPLAQIPTPTPTPSDLEPQDVGRYCFYNSMGQLICQDSCGLIEVSVQEPTVCPRLAKTDQSPNCTSVVPIQPGQTNNLNRYTNIYSLKNIAADQLSHTVTYRTYSSFCTSAYGQLYAPKCWIVCNDNPQTEDGEATIAPGQTAEVAVERSSPTGSVCGTYQLDLDIFAVDGNTNCIYRGSNPGETVGAWGYCETGLDCPVNTPTPTSEVTPTPTTCPTPATVENLKIVCPICEGS